MTTTRRAPPRRDALRLGLHAAAAVTLLPLLGCSLNNSPRREFQVLRDLPGDGPLPAPATRIPHVLLLAVPTASSLYDSDRMVYSVDGLTRSYFEYGLWAERPARSLNKLALQRLQRSGVFEGVASSTAGVRGDLQLTLGLEDLYFDESQPDDLVRLVVSATLVDWRRRRLLAAERFTQQQPSPTRDDDGMARAAGIAVGRLLDQLVAWCARGAAAG